MLRGILFNKLKLNFHFTMQSRFLRSGWLINTRTRKWIQMARIQSQYNTNNLSVFHISHLLNKTPINIFPFIHFPHSKKKKKSFLGVFHSPPLIFCFETYIITNILKIYWKSIPLLKLNLPALTRNFTWSLTTMTASTDLPISLLVHFQSILHTAAKVELLKKQI